MPVNLETLPPQLGFPDLAEFQLVIASVSTQSVSSVVNAPSKFIRKNPSTITTQASQQTPTKSVTKFPSVTSIPSVQNAVAKSLTKSITTLEVDCVVPTPAKYVQIAIGVSNVDVTQQATTQEVLKSIAVFSNTVEYQSDILVTVTALPPQQDLDATLNQVSLIVAKFPSTFEVDAAIGTPTPVVTKHIELFEITLTEQEITALVGPTAYEVVLTANIPSFYIIIDPVFAIGYIDFLYEDTWEASIVTDNGWYLEFTTEDTWLADIGVDQMLIVSRDHIEITVTLKQNATANYNIPTGSTVKASIIHPTLPETLVGPVTLVEDTHWTADTNEVTAEFDAGSTISSSTAILEIQVVPPSGKTKSFFSVGMTVKQDTID